MPLRIRSLTVKGFRAFGAAEQTLNLPADIVAVWGPNSKGKTSLAEAFEFLLTGRIARRELMASSQDEFADALRNAHLPAGAEVYVAARAIAVDGTPHEIRRVLTGDYGKRQDCTSRLEIDGAAADEADLQNLGITLSQPPLRAPVLAQHTLSYIFSAGPQDRATYFKTLLEVTDLDGLRNDIAALTDELKPPDDPSLAKFDTCAAVAALKEALGGIMRTVPDLATFTARIRALLGTMIVHGAVRGIYATTADRFSGPAEREAKLAGERGCKLELVAYDRLVDILRSTAPRNLRPYDLLWDKDSAMYDRWVASARDTN